MARNFRKLQIYVLSYAFLLRLYREVLPSLPSSERCNVFSQLQRSATSVVLNIVEGAARRSNKAFTHHLQIAYGSAKESEVLLDLCFDLGYIDASLHSSLQSSFEEVKARLYQFMRAVEKEIVVRQDNYTLL